MSEPNKTLLIDMGNSRIKCCYKGAVDRVFYVTQITELANYLNQVKHCVIAAVGQRNQLGVLIDLLNDSHITHQQLTVLKEQFGLKCAYAQPDKMGIDRWLAMLACQQYANSGFAILDFGTAMTCDFVDNEGQHLGGWIAPGINTMKKSLLDNTEQVTVSEEHSTLLQLGQNTNDCVNFGCLAAMQGFLSSAMQIVSRISSEYTIFIAGGDVNLLENLKNEQIEIIENPVLKGIERVISG